MRLTLCKWILSMAALVLLISPAPAMSLNQPNTAPKSSGPVGEEAVVPEITTVTLITGDVVTVMTNEEGKRSFSISPANPSLMGQQFLTIKEGEHTYIFPDGVDFNKLDKELFDIDYLLDEKYDKETSLPLLVSYLPDLSKPQVQALQTRITFDKEAKIHQGVHTISTSLGYRDIASTYGNLIKQPEVQKIWLDKKYHVRLDDSAPLVGAPWWYSNMADQGEGIIIAILDTGIDSTHPALDDLDDDPLTNDPKVILNQNFSWDDNYNDWYGHGTHCAGIAAGTAAGSVYQGIAPKAFLWNVKVLDEWGSGSESGVIDGIEFASLGPDGVANTGDEAAIISMSLGDGVTDGTDPASQAVNLAVERGVTVVIAAGNSGSSPKTITTPATAEKAISVAATDKSDVLAYFSSRGPTLGGKLKPDIAAPGVNITSSVPTDPAVYLYDPSGYRSLSGTSMATPHVAGASALLKQHYGEAATPQFIKDALMSTALDVGYDICEQGAGRLNLTWDPLPSVWVTPATMSLGPYTDETTGSASFTFFTTDNSSSHDVALTAQLKDTAGTDYSNLITLDQSSFTIPASGQVVVNMTIDLSTLPLSLERFDGKITATVDSGTSGPVHTVFGFIKTATITIHKTDISGNPAQSHLVYVLSENAGQYPMSGYTDSSGNYSLDCAGGIYNVVSRGTDASNDTTIFTVVEDINVTGDTLVQLDERNTNIVNFNPNSATPQKPTVKISGISIDSGDYGLGFSNSWYYPESFITRVSPNATAELSFNYACYPLADFKPYSPELVNSGEWYNVYYRTTGLTGDITFVANTANLVHRNTSYCLPLHEERARVTQYCMDEIFYYTGYTFYLDAPRQRWEWLTPNRYYYTDYERYMNVTGNCWEYYPGSTYYSTPGEYTWAIGCQPLSSGIDYSYIYWNEPDNYMYIGGRLFQDSYGNEFNNYCARRAQGHITITQDGTRVVDQDTSDYVGSSVYFSGQPHFTVEVTGQITVDPQGETQQELSGSSYTRFDIDAVNTHSDCLPPILHFRVPGIDLYGIVPGGQVTVNIQATDSSPVSSINLSYSNDGGATWKPTTPKGLSGGWYTFDLGFLHDCFISLAAEATDSYGNYIYHRTMSGFRVGAGPSQKFVGAGTSGPGIVSANYINLSKFTASATGTVNQIRVYGTSNGHVKVAIYADNAGQPGSLISANSDNSTVVAEQWNNIAIPDTPVTLGTAYWLGAILDNNNAVTKVVSANPYRYKAQAYNGFSWPGTITGLSTADSIFISAAGWGPIPPLSITTTTLPEGNIGVPYSQTLQATGGTGTYTWATIGSLPTNLSLNASTGLISGTPSSIGTTSFTAQVNDGYTTDNRTLSININAAVNRLVGTATSDTGIVGASYINLSKFTATTTGLVNQIRVYGTSVGNVKVAIYADGGGQPGALLSASDNSTPVAAGQWNNIPIASTPVASGTAYWLGAIMDTNSAVTKVVSPNPYRYKPQTYSGFTWPGTISGLSSADSIYLCIGGWGVPGPVPLDITTTSLPNGYIGVPYSQTLQAIGGSGNYTWSIPVGSLPNGLSLTPATGLISGTPTGTGTSSFTVRVNDGSTSDTQPLSITVTVSSRKLLGTDTTGTGFVGANYINMSKFTATATGTINQVRVYGTANGNVKVAIYADSGGQPGALLRANNSSNHVTADQWTNISITGTPVTSGNAYWLAAIMDNNSAVTKVVSANPYRYVLQTYDGFSWPPTITGLITADSIYICIAGWGTVP